MSGLSDLSASLREIVVKLDEANVTCDALRDTGDVALNLIGAVGQGSQSELIERAMSGVAHGQALLEDVTRQFAVASEALEAYLSANGL